LPAVSPKTIVLLTVFIDLMGFSLIIPLINYLVDELGGGILQVGLLLSSYSVAQFIFLPIWGRVSDRWGRRPVILFGLAGSAGSFYLFGMADPAMGLTGNMTLLFWILVASRFLQGAANANLAAATAYIADITPPSQRARGMGQLGAAFGLGFVIGPAIGGLLGQWGLWVPAFLAAILSGVNLAWASRWLPESLPPSQRQEKRPFSEGLAQTVAFLKQPITGLVLATFGVYILAFSTIFGTYVEYAKENLDVGVSTSGLLFAYMGLISILIQGKFVGPMVVLWKETTVARIGMALMVLGLALIPESASLLIFIVATTLFSVGNGLVLPTLNALLSQTAGRRQQGAALGLGHSIAAMGRMVGPFMGALFWEAMGYAAPFRVAAMLMVTSLIMACFIAQPGNSIVEADETGPLVEEPVQGDG